jgi:hypothetical protein
VIAHSGDVAAQRGCGGSVRGCVNLGWETRPPELK